MHASEERGAALIALLLIAAWLLFKRAFSVTTSLAGNVTPQSAKSLNYGNIGYFAPVAGNAKPVVPYDPGVVPMAPNTDYASGPFPFAPPAVSTLDTSGLTSIDHSGILAAKYLVY